MKENVITIHRAQGVDLPLPMTIEIGAEVPNFGERWIAESQRLFKEDARKMADVIFQVLPGGTVDRLIVEMMTRRASMLVVPFQDFNGSNAK